MTPKEKANELVNKFNKYTVQQLLYNKNNKTVQYFGDAKECALIAVNEILEGLGYNKLSDSPYTTLVARQYYVQVKKEIRNK
jgi:hypothetical protein